MLGKNMKIEEDIFYRLAGSYIGKKIDFERMLLGE